MAVPSPAEVAGLSARISRFARLGFLDFVGDPLRATDAPYPLTFVGNPDTELNGSFFTLPTSMVNMSEIEHNRENTSTLTVSLSGLPFIDDSLRTLVATRSNWVGRAAAVWFMVFDEAAQAVGAPWRHYTGRMVNVTMEGSFDKASISVTIENYLANIAVAANRTYMSQQEYDPDDRSAAASIAAANSKTASSKAVPPGEGGGGFWDSWRGVDAR